MSFSTKLFYKFNKIPIKMRFSFPRTRLVDPKVYIEKQIHKNS